MDHGVKWKKKEGLAATQSGLEVKVKGEAWVVHLWGSSVQAEVGSIARRERFCSNLRKGWKGPRSLCKRGGPSTLRRRV